MNVHMQQDVLCLFSANTAHHFPYNGCVTPARDVGQKVLAERILLLPAQDQRVGNNVLVRANGRTLVYEGVQPELEVEGSSVNVAIILTKLGRTATVAAPLHDDFDGQAIQLTLERESVTLIPFPRQGGTAVTAAITHPSGETTLYCRKPSYRYEPAEVAAKLAGRKAYRYAVASGITELELPLVRELFSRLRRTRRVFVPHYSLLKQTHACAESMLQEVLALVDVLQINEREANALIRRNEETPVFSESEGIRILMQHVPESPGPDVIIVTLGKRGAATVVFRNGAPETFHHNAAPVADVVDTTGAGDAFLAGFIHAEAAGCSHEQSAAFATLVASENIKGRGGHYAQVGKWRLGQFLKQEQKPGGV